MDVKHCLDQLPKVESRQTVAHATLGHGLKKVASCLVHDHEGHHLNCICSVALMPCYRTVVVDLEHTFDLLKASHVRVLIQQQLNFSLACA